MEKRTGKRTLLTMALTASVMLLSGYAKAADNHGRTKEIDNGGSGLFKAIAVEDSTLDGFVVYRPKDLYWASCREKKLPILIWGNGGCTDTSVGYERTLIEIASRGYVVIAIGAMQMVANDRKEVHTPSSMMSDAMTWICRQAKDRSSDYHDCVDTTLIAAAGHSCGGAQVLCNSADKRLKTYLILNAGMGNMKMAGASQASLDGLHGPILYLTGGRKDMAYENAQLDYARIEHVPVALGDMPSAGHGGTYNQKSGGDFGRMIIAWLDWQLKGRDESKGIFVQSDLAQFPGWTMKHKNFGTETSELWLNNGKRRIYGIVSKPEKGDKHKVAIVAHGFNGTHHFARDYFELLNNLGYLVYAFDFPCGSVNSKSDNNTINMSIIDEKEDLKAIVGHFRRQPDVDPNSIILIGESQGGLAAALAAGELKEQVSRLILIYPALCIPDNWNSRYHKAADIPDTTAVWNVPLGRRFFEELRHMNVYKAITRYKGPVQIIHGSKDKVVPLSYSERAMKLYNDAHLGVIPGAGHGFKPAERRISNQFVGEFLSRHIF